MTKSKAAGEKVSAAAETAIKNGADALKVNFEKAAQSYDHLLGYGKDTLEAYLKAATIAGKGAETLQNEVYTYSKQSIEDSISAAKAIMSSKSVHEAFELQTDFAKSAFESYVGEVTKFSELFVSTAKGSIEPLQGRVQSWVDVVQTARVA